jgi:hypothetical protein
MASILDEIKQVKQFKMHLLKHNPDEIKTKGPRIERSQMKMLPSNEHRRSGSQLQPTTACFFKLSISPDVFLEAR